MEKIENGSVGDETFARSVADDLARGLALVATEITDPVYAVSLWTDAADAEYGINFNTEAFFEEHRARYAALGYPEEEIFGPAGLRWNSGDWASGVPRRFLSAETTAALAPLAEIARDDTGDELAQETAWQRWEEIGYAAVTLAQPLSRLPATPTAIAYVELAHEHCVPMAEAMLRTVPPDRLHRAIPYFRRLADEVRNARADQTRVNELRRLAEPPSFPRGAEPSPDPLTAALRACGMSWSNVVSDGGYLPRALRIADAR